MKGDGPRAAMADEAWRGWDPRAAAPLFALALVLTAALLASRFLFNDLTDALLTYFVVLILWPGLLFVAAYRAVTYTYRITDRALVVDRGFLNRPVPPLAYGEMTAVEHGSNWFYSRLGVGWVRVTMADGRIATLPSLRDPAAFADLLRRRSQDARHKSRSEGG